MRLIVRLEAEGAEEARARIEDLLPTDADYTIEDVAKADVSQKHRALAEDGPAAEDQTLTVEVFEGGGWPRQVVWTTGRPEPDQRHLYRFKDMALTPAGFPNYEFVRTLDTDELEPAA